MLLCHEGGLNGTREQSAPATAQLLSALLLMLGAQLPGILLAFADHLWQAWPMLCSPGHVVLSDALPPIQPVQAHTSQSMGISPCILCVFIVVDTSRNVRLALSKVVQIASFALTTVVNLCKHQKANESHNIADDNVRLPNNMHSYVRAHVHIARRPRLCT